MAINYTATSAINAWLTTTDDDGDALCEGEVTLLAFGWADAAPETTTGVWVLGAALGGVTFIPARAIKGLRPRPSHVESALIGIKEEAAEALRVASDLELRFDQVMPQVRVAEGLAVGGIGLAGEAKEEAEEVEEQLETVEAKLETVEAKLVKMEEGQEAVERQEPADQPEANAVAASGPRQRPAAKVSASKPTGRASASKPTGRASTRRDSKNKTRPTVG